MVAPPRERLDVLLVERGFVSTREKAQRLILSGNVLVNEVPATKPGTRIDTSASLRIRGGDCPFVSRAGLKLHAALEHFKIEVRGRRALDLGASTGGFTQVLLLNGAQRVYSVDVGKNQMDWAIRNDPNVVLIDGINARYLEFNQIGTMVDIITIDLSFISMSKIFQAAIQFSKAETDWVGLIKPQFEVGPNHVGKGGIVREPEYRQEAIDIVFASAREHRLRNLGIMESPIRGAKGNVEFLAHWRLDE